MSSELRPSFPAIYHWSIGTTTSAPPRCQEDITQARLIGEMWEGSITGGQGRYWNCNLDAEHQYHYNAMGRIDYHDFEKKRGLYNKLAKYLTKIDEYAAMLVKGSTFQTSRKPESHNGPRRGRPRLYQSTHLAHGDSNL